NLRGQFNLDKTFGDHNIVAIVGAEVRENEILSNSLKYYGYNPENLTIGYVDYSNSYPNIVNGGKATIDRGQSLGDKSTRFLSFFANSAYNLLDKYTFSVSMRRDASNLFGLKTKDRWNPLWSRGFAWNVSKEPFFNINHVPYLNLRASYGFSGNVDPSMVAVNTIRFLSPNVYTGDVPATFSNYYNPQLKWETSKVFNLGLDFRLKNSRLAGTIEYFQKRGENLFGFADFDYTS